MESSIDEVASPILGEVKALLESEFHTMAEALLGKLLPPIRQIQSAIRDVRGHMDNVLNDLSATRELTNHLALGSVAALSTKKIVNPVVAAQLQSADMSLRSEVIPAVTISSVTRYMVSAFSQSDSGEVVEIIRILMFAPGANARKKARKTELGRTFMDVRIKIIRNMIFNCQVGVRKESMALLQPFLRLQSPAGETSRQTESHTGEAFGTQGTSRASRLKESPFRPPAWTGRGFISRDDVDIAVGEILNKEVDDERDPDMIDPAADAGLIQTQSTKRRKTVSNVKLTVREEISREVVKHMWKRWTDWFGNARNEARKVFTMDLGVVFLEPKSRWKPICSCSSLQEYTEEFDNLPTTENCSMFRTNYEVNASNLSLFKDMLNDFPNFVMTCQYNVEVFDGIEEMAQKQGGQERIMRRSINLLKVAANFLIAYFQVRTLEMFLCGSEKSLKFIFIVALGFSDIVSRASRPRTGNSAREAVASEAKDLGLLIPGDTGRLNFLMDKCLRMTKEKYDAKNVREDNPAGSDDEPVAGEGFGSDDEDVQNVFACSSLQT